MHSIGLVDDHVLLRQGLANLIKTFEGYKVLFEADNGMDLIEKLNGHNPSAILLDINMPKMDGFKTAAWLKQNHPSIKILALSMSDEEETIIKMLHAGAHGYILKNTTPEELKNGLDAVIIKGYYLNEAIGANVFNSLTHKNTKPEDYFDISTLNKKEIQFIKLSCTELSYLEIADKMAISPKTIDFYKVNLEKKIGIKNRVTLALFALKHGIVKL
jgi:two-component system, NarL family, invasion response regulator UvrY